METPAGTTAFMFSRLLSSEGSNVMFTRNFSDRKAPRFRRGLWAALALTVAALVFTGCPNPVDEPEDGVPSKPVIASVTPGDGSLTVTWGAVTGAASYEVYHNTLDTTEGMAKFEGDGTVPTRAVAMADHSESLPSKSPVTKTLLSCDNAIVGTK
jgi:hypothetical protein